MSFFYYRNASFLGTPKIHSKNTGVTALGQSTRLSGVAMNVGNRMVFTSALFHGAFGPPKQTTDAYYSDYYTPDMVAQFGTQPYNGYQNFTVPTTGTYRFTIQGGYAGHNNLQGINSNNLNSSAVTISPTDTGTGETTELQYGLPGHLVADVTLNAGDQLNILVGQAGSSVFTNQNTPPDKFDTAGTGGGASCVWVGSVGSSNYAIAGGAGANRSQTRYSNTRTGLSPYGTTGGSGDYGGGTNGGGATVGSGGNGPGGAGLTGSGGSWSDLRSDGSISYINPRVYATRLDQGGQGGVGCAGYLNPFATCDQGSLSFTVDASTYKVTTARAWAGDTGIATKGFVSLSTYEDYLNGTTSSITGIIPCGGHSGGFGGGACANWGGAGGGGGYSGGGGGANSNAGGGGSSYLDSNKWTQVSHTNYNKINTSSAAPAATDFHNFNIPSSLVASGDFVISSGTLPTGCWKGNGFVTMERTA